MGDDDANFLNMLSKEEFWDVARELKPGITWDEFEEKWERYCAMKAEVERRRSAN